jgi:tripartite-type tricarboxylate transporter receptor subunit TctC
LCNILAARPNFPANTVSEVIALAKTEPGKLNYATQGIASTGHLAGELLKSLSGIDIVQVAYKGGSESVTALLGGEIELAFLSVAGIRSIGPSRIKAIGVTCAKRDTALSSVPTFAESGVPSYDATFWYGLLAPARTPSTVIEELNRAMTMALTDTTIMQQLETQGLLAAPSSAENFSRTIRDDYAKWKKVLSVK